MFFDLRTYDEYVVKEFSERVAFASAQLDLKFMQKATVANLL